LTVGPLEENCWLLIDAVTRQAVAVDPGDEAERVLAAIAEHGCTLHEIWLTHAHFDHVGAVAALLRERDVPVRLHPSDLPIYHRAASTAAVWGLTVEQPTNDIVPLSEGDVLAFGAAEFLVWHLPGHAPGHVAFIGSGLCISGDVLFAGSIGRTDLPGCNPRDMSNSLGRLSTLEGAIHVLPGHGEPTTIAREREQNPFLSGLARPISA
jgi:glyoxylase-like metal-dependent hydrolase (beta-lactamase superfamily II)